MQTLIFGALLAIFGYWLDLRQEAYKQELAEQTEKTKALLLSLEPHIQLRRAAYLEFQKTARRLKNRLEVYYSRATDPPQPGARRYQLESLQYELRISGGFGPSSSWVTPEDVVSVVQDLVFLREQYEDVSSDKVNAAIDGFINSVIKDMRDSVAKSNDTEAFHSSARRRLREGFEKLNSQIEQALGIEYSPLK